MADKVIKVDFFQRKRIPRKIKRPRQSSGRAARKKLHELQETAYCLVGAINWLQRAADEDPRAIVALLDEYDRAMIGSSGGGVAKALLWLMAFRSEYRRDETHGG